MALPRSLPPTIITSINVGLALGGYVLTIPFKNDKFPGPAIALWFRDFFQPGFISITTLAALTLTTGFRAFRTKPASASEVHRAKAKTASRWAAAGLTFTLLHFTYGNTVLAIMDRISSKPEAAQTEMASWMSMHILRTLTTDIPAWLCFIGALTYEI
ncbi:hypothetical protein ESCO_006788 [Escovopsis weberi]|uniref:Uncharacterized protein n=1 Tax=Escovopsis weberi TaxID=150374 RepID=A0A0M8N1R1_ESCWE|nr:hypothetical protein ESCO_006788 [Escovopsis weberi]